MVNIISGSHHHFKGWDQFTAGCAVPCSSKEPQVVPATEDEVGFRVQGGAHLSQTTVAAGTFEAVLVPVFVQGLEQVAVFNLAIAASAPLLFPFGLNGEHRHTLFLVQHHRPEERGVRLRAIRSRLQQSSPFGVRKAGNGSQTATNRPFVKQALE